MSNVVPIRAKKETIELRLAQLSEGLEDLYEALDQVFESLDIITEHIGSVEEAYTATLAEYAIHISEEERKELEIKRVEDE